MLMTVSLTHNTRMTDSVSHTQRTGDFKRRIMLMYDGIHYDALHIESPDSSSITTVFQIDDPEVCVWCVCGVCGVCGVCVCVCVCGSLDSSSR